MDLQMQVRRGVLALVLGLALGGVALGRAHPPAGLSVHGVGAVIRAVQHNPGCDASLRIELGDDARLTIPCDRSCAPMRGVFSMLHVATTTRVSGCTATQTA